MTKLGAAGGAYLKTLTIPHIWLTNHNMLFRSSDMVTRTHSLFETLARVIEQLDGDGRSVRRTEASGSDDDGSLRATVVVSVGTGSESATGLDPVDATVDGGLAVTFRAPAFPDPEAALSSEYPRVSATPTDVARDGDGVVVTLRLTIGDADRSADEGGVIERDEDRSAATAAFGAQSADVDAGTGDPGTAGDDRGGEANSDIEAADTSADDADTGATSPLAAVRDESVPAYDDTPYLRRLYETCETFAEMSDRIEMDVSAETVRRYMTDAGVHTPTSYETTGRTSASSDGTASDAESDASVATESTAGTGSVTATESTAGTGSVTATESTAGTGSVTATESTADTEPAGESAAPASRGSLADGDHETTASLPDEHLVTDGIGLPESLTLHDVVDAVVDARTVHEVQREVGLGYDRTRQLLCQLNVLDLVVGRVTAARDRTVTVDVVADRIRESAPDAA